MKKTLMLVGALGLLWASRGRAAETAAYEEVVKGIISALKEGADTLATIKDKDTAKAAAPKLRKVAESLRGLKKKADQLGNPSEDQKAELEKKYKKDMETAQTSFRKEVVRVRNVPGGKEALQEMEGK